MAYDVAPMQGAHLGTQLGSSSRKGQGLQTALAILDRMNKKKPEDDGALKKDLPTGQKSFSQISTDSPGMSAQTQALGVGRSYSGPSLDSPGMQSLSLEPGRSWSQQSLDSPGMQSPYESAPSPAQVEDEKQFAMDNPYDAPDMTKGLVDLNMKPRDHTAKWGQALSILGAL